MKLLKKEYIILKKAKLKVLKSFLGHLSVDSVLDILEFIDDVIIDNINKFSPKTAGKIQKPIVSKLKSIQKRIDEAIKNIED